MREHSSPLSVPGQLAERVRVRPDGPFLITAGGDSLSSAEIDDMTARMAGWLVDRISLRDRVVIALPNCPELVLAWLGSVRAGAIACAINPEFTSAEVERSMGQLEPTIVVTSTALVDRFADSVPLVVVEDAESSARFTRSGDTTEFSAVIRDPRRELPALSGDDPASIVLTSGSTGRPKGVVQSHASLVLTGQAFPYWMGLNDREVTYTCLPLFHINAQAYSLMSAVASGLTLALGTRFSASGFWDELRGVNASHFNAVGSILNILDRTTESPVQSPVRVCYSAPAFPPDEHERLEAKFGFKLLVGYGLSESPFGTISPLVGNPGLGSVGRPRFHPSDRHSNEVEIVDPDEDGVGEIALRNDAMMSGYWNDEEQTAKSIREGWLYTGDLGRFDDGYLYFVGRNDDRIRRRGENISPLEVEQCVQAHPEVEEVAVFGVPSELTESEVAAMVIVRRNDESILDEILEFCEARLAPHKIPRYWKFADSIPSTPTNKTERSSLASLWNGDGHDWIDLEDHSRRRTFHRASS